MKQLLALVIVLAGFTSTAAFADYCTADMVNRRGGIITSSDAYGFNRQDACSNALRQCNQDLRQRQRWGQNPAATCQLRNRRPGPRPRPGAFTCNATMRRGNGAFITSFSGRSRFSRTDACTEARRACNQDLRWRQRQGRNPRAYCDVDGRGGRPGRDFVTRSCTVDRYGRRSGFVQSHFGQASGRRGTGVKQRACADAMRQCQRSTVRRQYCVQR